MGSQEKNGHDALSSVGRDAELPGAPLIWKNTRDQLRGAVSPHDFERYIEELRVIAEADGRIILAVRSRFIRDRIGEELRRQIARIWKMHDPKQREISLIAWDSEGRTYRNLLDDPWAAEPAGGDAPGVMSAAEITVDREHQTFETLVAGPSNAKASELARHIAEGRGLRARVVLMHGPQGVGKTHLVTAIQQAVAAAGDGRRVVYITAEEFQTEYVAAAMARDSRALKSRLRGGDLLLIEDLQTIANAPETDREFCRNLRAVTANGGLVVVTADAGAAELSGFSARLRSELKGAASVEIEPPDPQMRRAIVRMHVDLIAESTPAFQLDDDMVDMICERVRGNGRELLGALWTLHTEASMGKAIPTRDMLERVLRRQAGNQPRPTMVLIKKATSQVFGVSRSDLEGEARTQSIVYPRHIAMYLCRTMAKKSYPQIGKTFGNRDHATVIYAEKRILRDMDKRPDTVSHLEEVRAALYALQG